MYLGTAIDRTDSLGIQKMPPGYHLLQLDSGHYQWAHENDRDESSIHWNKWVIYRWAWQNHRACTGDNK